MPSVSTPTRTLKTAEERREALIVAAIPHFARRGFYGTPTTEIAASASISQAYLFRLFPTKQELWIACIERCMDRVRETFVKAITPHIGDEDAAFEAAADAYQGLLGDRTLLLGQLQSYAGCDDPVIRAAVQRQYGVIVDTVKELTGGSDERVSGFIATGMLLTVMAAMDAFALDEPWVDVLMSPKTHPDR